MKISMNSELGILIILMFDTESPAVDYDCLTRG